MITASRNYDGLNLTYQVTEDCNLRCSYCLPSGTQITMSDLSTKNIEDISVGESILGFDEYSTGRYKHRKVYPSKVTQTMARNAETILISLRNGVSVEITPDHPICNTRGSSKYSWKEAGRYVVGDHIRILPLIQPTYIDTQSHDYKIGYFISVLLGDESHKAYIDKNGYDMFKIRIAMTDPEPINFIDTSWEALGFLMYRAPFAINGKASSSIEALFANKRSDYDHINRIITENVGRNSNTEYLAGFLAGIYDAEGNIGDHHTIRIFSSSNTILREIERALSHFGFGYIYDRPKQGKNLIVQTLRLIQGVDTLEYLRFIMTVQPKIPRKGIQNIYNTSPLTSEIITSVNPGRMVQVFNLSTESHTYIANNVAVHNCYEHHKRPGDLPLDYANRFTRIILDDDDPIGVRGTDNEWMLNQGLILDFIGGDALMRPRLVDDIMKYFQFYSGSINHKWAYRWRMSISTNGTLFGSSEVQEFIDKYRFNLSIGVSVDGCPDLHNMNRSKSFAAIEKNWPFYLDFCDNMGQAVGTKATFNKASIPYLSQSIQFMHEQMGMTQISCNFIFEEMNLAEEDYMLLESEMEKTVDYILSHRNDLYVSMFDKGFGIGSPYGTVDLNCGWCGAGSMPGVSVNGRIYPCFRFFPVTMVDEKFDFHVGDVWRGMYRKDRFLEVRQQSRSKISPEKCKECSIESSCAWCIGGAFSETGTFWRPTALCRIKTMTDKWARIYWDMYNKEKDNGNE